MGRRRARILTKLAWVAVASVAVWGCSLVTDLDGLSGGKSTDSEDSSAPAPIDSATDTTTVDASDAAAPTCDASSDPQNCGSCGHSCLGGTCSAGACQPVQLAPTQGGAPLKNAFGLALDRTGVYFTNTRFGATLTYSVYAVPKNLGGCPTARCYPQALWSGAMPANLAVNDDTVFVTSFVNASTSNVIAIAKDGGGAKPFGGGAAYPIGIALHDTALYWTAYGASFSVGTVLRRELDAGPLPDAGNTVLASYGTSGASILDHVMVDNANAYWSETVTNGSIRLAPRGPKPGPMKLFAPGSENTKPGYMVQAQDSILWVDGSDRDPAQPGGIQRAGTTGGCPNAPCPLVTSLPGPAGLAVDETYAYITTTGSNANHSDGKVLRIRLDGTCGSAVCPEVLATGQNSPGAIRVDAEAIYWVNRGTTTNLGASYPNSDASLMKLAK